MRQVEKYLLKITLLLGIFFMPFAASAEEIDMGEKFRELAMFNHDSRSLRAILFGYCEEIRAFVIVTYSFWYVID